jgi:hypothetical protein
MQDGEIGISVFPKRKEILVGNLCLGLISRQSARSGELQARQCTPGKVPYPPSVINELLKFGRCRIPVVEDEIGFSANDSDVVVGSSINSTFTTLTATIWKNGVPADLNTLIPANSSLYLMFGCSINSRGQILGLATNLAGTVYHAYELIPVGE